MTKWQNALFALTVLFVLGASAQEPPVKPHLPSIYIEVTPPAPPVKETKAMKRAHDRLQQAETYQRDKQDARRSTNVV